MEKIKPVLNRTIDIAEAEKLPASTIMELYYPLLDYLPHVSYRSVAELILFAIAIRSNRIFKDKHPAFFIFGKTMAFKTRFAYFMAHMIGKPPEKVCHNLQLETKKSTIFRRDSKGEIQYVSDVLSEPFVNLDEYGFADENVRHAMKIFIDGRIKLPVENRQLTINCVPLITTNPVKKAKWFSLEYMLDIQEPQVRRSIILFTDTLGMAREWLVKYGEDIINYAAASKPVPVANFKPPRRKVFSRDDKYEVYELVEEYANHHVFESGFIDIDMLMQLAVGAMAYIPVPEKALKRVIQNYFRIISTTGWIKLNKLQNLFRKDDATRIRQNLIKVFKRG